MFGMTVREQSGLGGGGPFFDRVVAGVDLLPAADTPDLRDYVERALRGRFPEPALRLGETARRAWLESYVEHLLTRDAEQVDGGRDPVRLTSRAVRPGTSVIASRGSVTRMERYGGALDATI